MHMSQKLVFHQSKCICAIMRILSTTAMYVSSSSFMYLHFPCYCDACLNSSDLRVGLMTLLNTIQYNFQTYHASFCTGDYEIRGYLSTIRTHCLPGLPAFNHWFNTRMRQSAYYRNLKWTRDVKVRCHVIVTQETSTVEQSARKFRNLSLQTGKTRDMSEM